jgi:hypothetical protein
MGMPNGFASFRDSARAERRAAERELAKMREAAKGNPDPANFEVLATSLSEDGKRTMMVVRYIGCTN